MGLRAYPWADHSDCKGGMVGGFPIFGLGKEGLAYEGARELPNQELAAAVTD